MVRPKVVKGNTGIKFWTSKENGKRKEETERKFKNLRNSGGV